MADEYIYHHGIQGMRWGVRKNIYGPPISPEMKTTKQINQLKTTKATLDSSGNIVRESKNINSAVRSARTTAKYKEAESLTDQELKDRVARMNLEQQYSNLSAAKTSKGQAYVQNTLDVAGSVLAIAGSAAAIALAVKQLKG